MEVKHTALNNKGKFYLEHKGKEIGEMTYVFVNDNEIDIDHTLIDDEFRGKDLGLKLVKASVDYMRKHDLKAIPTCPYVKKVFDETAEYSDVRA
ncbi:MAG: GNAT family N-acetyltransferase [Aquaticitalea sp.]